MAYKNAPLPLNYIGKKAHIELREDGKLLGSVAGTVERLAVSDGGCRVFLQGNPTSVADIEWPLESEENIEIYHATLIYG